MLYLVCLLCLSPLAVNDDPRDEKIKQFLKAPDKEAIELYLWKNPSRTVTLNDIMIVYRKQYNIDIAINYSSFNTNKSELLLNHPVKKIDARDKYIPRGLALQLYLDSFAKDLTYRVDGGTIWIVPGKANFACEGKYSELGHVLTKTKPKYDDKPNREETNRMQIPPSDLMGALRFFGNEDRGNFRVFVREKELPKNIYQTRIKIPAYTDKTYDAILREILDQVGATYVVQDHAVLIVAKNGNGK